MLLKSFLWTKNPSNHSYYIGGKNILRRGEGGGGMIEDS